MKVLAKILTYFLAVVLLGALLAPPLYWATLGLASRCDPAGPLGNVMDFLTHTPFQKFYNRAALFCALALLWPTAHHHSGREGSPHLAQKAQNEVKPGLAYAPRAEAS